MKPNVQYADGRVMLPGLHVPEYPGNADSAKLQQVRNNFGPSWLFHLKLEQL
jgi:hypothetical protein